MNPKSLLIPVAAFAVAVTGVQAFNSDILTEVGLTEEQVAAFEVARELRQEGDKDGARDVLVEAGIDMETMHSIREAMHEHKHEMRDAMHDALAADDFDAFKTAVEGSPIADIVTSQADFDLFKEAHDLKEAGEFAAAKEIMDELGLPSKEHGHRHGHHHGFGMKYQADEE